MTTPPKNNDAMPELRPEECLQKILDVLGVTDLNINSRGLLEGYIRNTRPEAQQTADDLTDGTSRDYWRDMAHKLQEQLNALAAEKQPVDLRQAGVDGAEILVRILNNVQGARNLAEIDTADGHPILKMLDTALSEMRLHWFALQPAAPDPASVKEALEFYAQERNWRNESSIVGRATFKQAPVLCDHGKKARKALADLGLYAKSVEGK